MEIKNQGQMKIQQMAFMVVAVLFFFILVGLFVFNFYFKGISSSAANLNKDQAIASLETIAHMPELTCGTGRTLCLDEDKLQILSGRLGRQYDSLWPVSSVSVYKVYPPFEEVITCPALNCNYYELYDNGQTNRQEYSTFVTLCKKQKDYGYIHEQCEIAKLVVGMKIYEEN